MSPNRIRIDLTRRCAGVLVAMLVVAAGCSIAPPDEGASVSPGSADATASAGSPDTQAPDADADGDGESTPGGVGSADADEASEPLVGEVQAWPLRLGAAAPQQPDPTRLPIDPDVRMGELDNGLRYYARSNDSPGAAVSLRLAVNAGSLQQEVPDSGLAHFVEHMMFNGTESWPGNSLLDVLQRIGAEIGPDFNAFTSTNETVYLLDLPTAQPDHVATGFEVLAEWASKATMAQAEVIAEQGVVREEVRLRDEGPTAEIDARFDRAYFAGTPYENADPGGTGEQVLATTRGDVVRYYDRWYRPDNMAIVAVGDMQVDYLVDQITETFSGLVDRGDGAARTDADLSLIDEPIADVLVDPAAGTSFISIDWTVPVWDTGTVGGERLDVIQTLIATMMQARLSERVARGDAALFDPFVGHIPLSRDRALLGLNTSSLDLAEGTTTVLAEFATAASTGFTDEELRRAREDMASVVDQMLVGEATLQDSHYADAYWRHFLVGSDISSTQDQVERLSRLLDDLTVDEVSEHFAWLMQTAAPIVILVGETEADVPTRSELTRAIDEAALGGADAGAYEVLEVDRLVDPGPAGTVLDRQELDETDRESTLLVFANGARVLFAETAIDAGRVSLYARAEGGWSALDPDDALFAQVAVNAASRSGLGSIDALSLGRYMRSSQAWLSPFISETAEGFSGGSSADDLEDLFALVHLRSTAPAVEGPGLEQAKEDARDLLRNVRTDPATALSVEASRLRYDDDPRHVGVVTLDQLDDLDAARALEIYSERFVGVDDLTIAVAGDVDLDTVIDLSERYIATIPAKPADTWLDASPPLPPGVTRSEIEIGPPGSAGAVTMLFSTPIEWNNRSHVTLDLLDQILNQRLFETVREELSATYGGWIGFRRADEPDGTVESQVLIQGDPTRLGEIADAIVGEIDELTSEGPDAEEFDRAVTVLASDYGFITNDDLLDQLHASVNPDAEPLNTDVATSLLESLERDDIRELASQILPLGQRVEVIRRPES